MADKYLKFNPASGIPEEVEATVTSAGASNAGNIPALDGTGRLSATMMPVGVTPETKTIAAGEDLEAGNVVNIYNDSGAKVRKADCSNGRFAQGFVLSGVTSGQNATVYFEGNITGLSGLTPGATMFLSTTGALSATAPSTSGHYAQVVGWAVSASEVSFEPGLPIKRA